MQNEYKPGNRCEKCGRTSDLCAWVTPKESPIIFATLCDWCIADTEGFVEWFAAEMEKAVRESGEYEQLPDGKWRSKSAA